jgi:hypothetical protein
MENDKNSTQNADANPDADSAQRQSANQDIANDANNNAQADKVDSGSGTTARADTEPK